ncbi:MAG: hypothetical protein WKF37_07770 [Bryobacteraceae bacterium]
MIKPSKKPGSGSPAASARAGENRKLVAALRSIASTSAELLEKFTESDYFERNTDRMRYPKFRSQHFFVGSGVIEAGCKTVIGSRLKQCGMFWTLRGASAIIALRCCHLSRIETYWEARRAAHPNFCVAHPCLGRTTLEWDKHILIEE